MKNKKGFTLIELLAVIVILAIIALIATPIILNMINDAKKSAAVDSAYGYIKAIEYQNSIAQLNNEYDKITSDSVTEINSVVNVKGTKPTSGNVEVDESGRVTGATLCISGYNVTYNGEKAKATDTKCGSGAEEEQPEVTKYTVYQNGTAVYFNPTSKIKCTDYEEKNSNTGESTGCLKFYTFNDEGENSSTVNMILDHNTAGIVIYNSGSNAEMNNVDAALKGTTTSWDKDLKIRLITADEIAQITGNTTFNSSYNDYFYFETNKKVAPSPYVGTYGWLYENTNGCTSFGCKKDASGINGYWTATPTTDNEYNAWYVYREGNIDSMDVRTNGQAGVRPVITVEKNLIK